MDSDMYGYFLQGCAKSKSVAEGKCVHAHTIISGIQLDVFLHNNLVNMYAKCGCIEDARHMFDEMSNPNTVSLNTMIAAYSKCGFVEDALKMFVKISEPDVVSWNTVIAAFAENGDSEEALRLFQKMRGSNVKLDHFTYGTILKGMLRMGSRRRL